MTASTRPEAYQAHQAITDAIKDGRLTRKSCEVCNADSVDAHHDDYSRPLDVRWLCRKHHMQVHRSRLGRKFPRQSGGRKQHLQTVEWARMPKPGQRLMDLTRSTLLEIIQDPQSGVRSAVIRKPGRTRGIRLIFLPSLFAYFERLAAVECDGQ